MESFRWLVGLSVALVLGGIVTQIYARRVRQLVGDQDPHYRISDTLWDVGSVDTLPAAGGGGL
ncbi:hypothetical protein [Desulfosarcina sp.]|uniref:hypothetical protein n=1 Tax=Desulfosarcina sp. TaxID=2027861 RepID=UPI0029AEDE1E|nr:hypothetical protein [Desulfosarcina sp.]MDX2452471.1 hypothetical protein [Desulfosarcina sp.]